MRHMPLPPGADNLMRGPMVLMCKVCSGSKRRIIPFASKGSRKDITEEVYEQGLEG